MSNYGEKNMYEKIKIHLLADFGIITFFSVLIIILNFSGVSTIYTTVCIILCLIICAVEFFAMLKFIGTASTRSKESEAVFNQSIQKFNQSIQKNVDITQESIMDMLDIHTKQRELLAASSKLAEKLKNFSYKLQSYSSTALTSNEKVAEKTKQTINYADEGYINIQSSINKMQILNEKMGVIANLIVDLSEHIEQISSTISVVENIAEQTNMLALNTAVEAARAGEHGKGFAVVAGEIRKLADESKQATHKIIYMINSIQQVANTTVAATEQGTIEIEKTVKIVQKLEENANNLKMSIKDILLNIENISYNITSQATLPDEADDIIKTFETNTIVSSEMLDKTIERITVINKITDTFQQVMPEINDTNN